MSISLSTGAIHWIPIEWAKKGVRKEDYVRPWLQQMERQGRYGVYFIIKSMELGTTFRSAVPKYPTADPNYRILARERTRYGGRCRLQCENSAPPPPRRAGHPSTAILP